MKALVISLIIIVNSLFTNVHSNNTFKLNYEYKNYLNEIVIMDVYLESYTDSEIQAYDIYIDISDCIKLIAYKDNYNAKLILNDSQFHVQKIGGEYISSDKHKILLFTCVFTFNGTMKDFKNSVSINKKSNLALSNSVNSYYPIIK